MKGLLGRVCLKPPSLIDFGGKSKIAHLVWQALGQPRHYIEPFFGSGAVLLARPGYDSERHVESVCDKDGNIANVWRSIQFQPDEVARWCDWPVNQCDLMARRKVLIANEERLLENLVADPEWCDPKLAGYWIWAASCWIGSGLTRMGAILNIAIAGKGINAGIPFLGHAGMGINAQRPHLSDAGKGINAKIPHLGNARGLGSGVHARQSSDIYDWMTALSWRLRKVRVVCGDWTRVCGGHWQDNLGTVGIFFDPPYSAPERDAGIYREDSMTIAHDVNAWCLERGNLSSYRIVLAGYWEEHQNLIENGWTFHRYSVQGGYANLGKGKQGSVNRHRETLFFSPHCDFSQLRLDFGR